MCGIFGMVQGGVPSGRFPKQELGALLRLSETRGSEASGVAILDQDAIRIAKSAVSAAKFVKSDDFKGAFGRSDNGRRFWAGIGHTRLVTNGSAIFEQNNQPVLSAGLVMVHNGIVTNDHELWENSSADVPRGELDSAALLARIATLNADHSLGDAVARAFGELNGSASIALLSRDERSLVLATNTGSLYVGLDAQERVIAFASERPMVEAFAESSEASRLPPIESTRQVHPNQLWEIDCGSAQFESRDLPTHVITGSRHPSSAPRVDGDMSQYDRWPREDYGWRADLRRCTRCILPETFPFITFDADGVCSQCHSYLPKVFQGDESLDGLLERYRSSDGRPDCVVAFSGGRDSAFGLDRLVNDFGMTPLAFTYDWGMVTDLARRNQARLCGAMGVEHILVSADIATKRRNIGKNLRAWLARPHLGMMTLLTAGDKEFFLHAKRIANRHRIQLVVFCVNPLETTEFKAGFAGVKNQRYYDSGLGDRLRLGAFYVSQFLRNPAYLNRSLFDSLRAYRATYFTRHDYVQLYEHLEWDEDAINQRLIGRYRWETDPSTPTTWRIGDGTAPFYNWVFYEAVGFTENDTFRSNQIREGVLDREKALEIVRVENQPRWEPIEEYLDLVDVPMELARAGIERLASEHALRRAR